MLLYLYITFISWIISLLYLQIVTWQIDAEDKYCSNHDLANAVYTQLACQYACLNTETCVGIAYSHKSGYTDKCYLCNDDALSSDAREFSFYRRKGNRSLH